MSKLPRISGRECIKALEGAGFHLKRQEGSRIIVSGPSCLSGSSSELNSYLQKRPLECDICLDITLVNV